MGLSVKVTMRKCATQIPPAYFADASAGSTVGFWSTALALGLYTYKRNQEILITGLVYHMFGICCKSYFRRRCSSHPQTSSSPGE